MESQLIIPSHNNYNKINNNNNKLYIISASESVGSFCSSGGGGGDSDIEMVSVDSLTSYTSLKDIIRSTPPLSPVDSPPFFRRIDSWREIPMKDPLLQHAAWAYLQPMNSEPDSDSDQQKSCFWKFKDCFCGFFKIQS